MNYGLAARCAVIILPVTGCIGACASEKASDDSVSGYPHAAQIDLGDRPAAGAPAECKSFDSSYAAIQALVFERHGCTANACHGQAKVGGLDLRADVSYANLVDAPSVNSEFARVQPGTAGESFLYRKLQAATHPGSIEIAGSPMPVGTPALSQDELDAVQLWILKGAPKTGVVADLTKNVDVGKLLNACLPPPKPVKTKPLDPPPAEEGVQFVLPHYTLKADSEVDICIPFAFDFTDKVPAQYKDVKRNVMFVNGTRVRQDPQSHHLILMNPRRDLASIKPAENTWACRGGERDGTTCDPLKGSADCGAESVCAGNATSCGLGGSEIIGNALPAGIRPEDLADPAKREALLNDPAVQKALAEALAGLGADGGGGLPGQIANTQSPQEYLPPMEGVYSEVPLRGVLYFNSHAFNLEDEDTVLEARVNFLYAKKLEREMRPTNVTQANYIQHGQPPFTRKTYCAKHVVPQHYSLALLTGHTHRRGEHFWVKDPSGKQIYENFVYNDPLYKRFEPWLDFSAADPEARTLEYCATFSNGLTKDGSPDIDLVTRSSRMPDRTSCKPVACVAGRVTASCSTDRDCDSAPGRNDGFCDACPITRGQTTENEMFVLMPWYVLPPKSP